MRLRDMETEIKGEQKKFWEKRRVRMAVMLIVEGGTKLEGKKKVGLSADLGKSDQGSQPGAQQAITYNVPYA